MVVSSTVKKKIKIKDISEVQIGFQFRKKLEPVQDGTYQVIQIRDLNEDRNLCVEDLYKITPEHPVERYLVNRRDVLFLARGHRNFAIPIMDKLEKTIVASYFFILKIRTGNILPEYLAWFINQAPAQEYLHNFARRGTHMPVVPKSAFENLTLDIPDIKTQEKIVKLNSLVEKERNLLNSIQEKRTLLIRSSCLKAAKRNVL